MSASRISNLRLSYVGYWQLSLSRAARQEMHPSPGWANQGLVPVSADSPFVGANVYLAKEMEDSLYLYNFLRSRGSPGARCGNRWKL
jgi:hypothetical protein